MRSAQRRRTVEADMLAARLVDVLDDWLTEKRAQRLVELWIRYGDG